MPISNELVKLYESKPTMAFILILSVFLIKWICNNIKPKHFSKLKGGKLKSLKEEIESNELINESDYIENIKSVYVTSYYHKITGLRNRKQQEIAFKIIKKSPSINSYLYFSRFESILDWSDGRVFISQKKRLTLYINSFLFFILTIVMTSFGLITIKEGLMPSWLFFALAIFLFYCSMDAIPMGKKLCDAAQDEIRKYYSSIDGNG